LKVVLVASALKRLDECGFPVILIFLLVVVIPSLLPLFDENVGQGPGP